MKAPFVPGKVHLPPIQQVEIPGGVIETTITIRSSCAMAKKESMKLQSDEEHGIIYQQGDFNGADWTKYPYLVVHPENHVGIRIEMGPYGYINLVLAGEGAIRLTWVQAKAIAKALKTFPDLQQALHIGE